MMFNVGIPRVAVKSQRDKRHAVGYWCAIAAGGT